MRQEELLLFGKLQKHYSGSLAENISSLLELVQVLSELIEAVADARIKIPGWRYHSQTLIGKIVFSSRSVLKLTEGIEYDLFSRQERLLINDYSSIFILVRAIIENYLTLCYIYNNKCSEEVKIFRYKLWEVSGLISRQNFSTNNFKEAEKKKEEEKVIIDRVLQEIKLMEDYRKLSKRQINNLNSFGLPRIFSWSDLIEESSLDKDNFSAVYSLFSSYAHSEYLSIIQLEQISLNINDSESNSNTRMALGVTRMIISLCIDYYVTNFKSAEIIYNTFPTEIRTAVDVWKKIGKQK